MSSSRVCSNSEAYETSTWHCLKFGIAYNYEAAEEDPRWALGKIISISYNMRRELSNTLFQLGTLYFSTVELLLFISFIATILPC
jgi:hypothetical protein